MAKITLANLSSTVSGSLISTVNANNDLLEAAIENTLSRDGTSPNEMNAELDMNSNPIYNLPEATTDTEPVRFGEFNEFVTAMDAAVAAAQAAQAAAEAVYDNFDDRYLGAKASPPTLDNDGNTLLAGALYFDTSDDTMYFWDGDSWESASVGPTGPQGPQGDPGPQGPQGPAGSGDVTGPGAAVVDEIVLYADGTGSLLARAAGTGVVLATSGVISYKTNPTGAFVGTSDSQTLTTKTIDLASNTLTGTTAQFNTALSDGDFATLAGSETLTNKTFALGSNTFSGTTAQFNTSLSDGDFATLAGTETLTNKTINLTSNTLTGTLAQFNTAISDADIQPLDATLTALAAYNTNGLLTQTAADTFAGRTVTGTGDQITVTNGDGVAGNPTLSLADNAKYRSITFIIDGGGATITTGVKGYLEIPFACTINRATALADQSGSIVVDIWKDTYANYPPVDADSITASAPVTISAATKSQDATLTGWTTSVAAGDILGFNVDSITTCQRVTIALRVVLV